MLTKEQTLTELRRTIPDYDEVYRPILHWVMDLPSATRRNYFEIVDHGTVRQVRWLIDHWRLTSITE